MTARALPAVSARRERLGRGRTDALLRRQARLEAEVREQLEPLLGAAGVAVDVAPLGLHRYAARVAGGGTTTVAIDRGTGFAATGARARVEGGAVACPVP